MRPDSRNVTLTLAITLPILCAVAMGVDRTAQARSRPANVTSTHPTAVSTARKVASASRWNVHLGPDPFVLPRRPSSDPPQKAHLRRVFHLDTPFIGHARLGESLTGRPPMPPIVPETTDTMDRMAGYLSGNGVYAVLETPDRTMVVNPGDRVDDNRIVTEIRPTSMRLRSDNANSLVTLRSSL